MAVGGVRRIAARMAMVRDGKSGGGGGGRDHVSRIDSAVCNVVSAFSRRFRVNKGGARGDTNSMESE